MLTYRHNVSKQSLSFLNINVRKNWRTSYVFFSKRFLTILRCFYLFKWWLETISMLKKKDEDDVSWNLLGTIFILRKGVLAFFEPTLLCKDIFSTWSKGKLFWGNIILLSFSSFLACTLSSIDQKKKWWWKQENNNYLLAFNLTKVFPLMAHYSDITLKHMSNS